MSWEHFQYEIRDGVAVLTFRFHDVGGAVQWEDRIETHLPKTVN